MSAEIILAMFTISSALAFALVKGEAKELARIAFFVFLLTLAFVQWHVR